LLRDGFECMTVNNKIMRELNILTMCIRCFSDNTASMFYLLEEEIAKQEMY